METWRERAFGDLLNRPLAAVELSGDKEHFVLRFQDGKEVKFDVDGDCCSRSWIEHLEAPTDLTGAVITDMDEPPMGAWDEHECDPEVGYERACGHDCLQVYHTRFRTDRGDIVLEYRNDSNGYYGGSLDRVTPREE